MIRAFSPFLALRYLVTRRINLLGVFGVAFAVWAMLVVDGVFTGFVFDIRTNVQASAPPLLLTDLPHDQSFQELSEALSDPDVEALAPRLRQHAMLQPVRPMRLSSANRGSNQLDFDHTQNGFAMLIGIDPLLEPKVVNIDAWLQRAPTEIARWGQREASKVLDEPDAGRRSELLLPDRVEWRARQRAGEAHDADPDNHHSSWPGIIMGWRRIFSLTWIQDGDPFHVICASFPADQGQASGTGSEVRMRTVQKTFASAGWFGSGTKAFDEVTAMVPIESLRTMLGHDQHDLASIDLVTDVAIRPRTGLSAAELAKLQRRLEQKAQAVLPAGSPPCAVLTWQEQNSVYLKAVEQEHRMMQIVLMIVMLVSAFVIYATLHMMVVQKIKDIGIVAAVGGSPFGIGSVFLMDGTIVGITGSLLGVTSGVLSALWINPVNNWLHATFNVEMFPRDLFDLDGIPCHLEPSWVVSVAIGAILLSIVVAYIPARKAARMNPVTALSFE